ncbi:alpha/beta fold hydrolase [Aeromicrobium sp. P5_D10]
MSDETKFSDMGWPRSAVTSRVSTNGIHLAVTTAGDGPPVLLVHGFPDLSSSWRRQVPALLEAGYRVIAPDMRGYGHSDRPADVESYDSATIGADLIGLLDAFEIDRAALVGHDWGASSVWPLAFSHPDRVRGIAGISVPFLPAAPVSPLAIMRKRLGDDFYMVRFQDRGEPEKALEQDVESTIVAVMCDIEPLSDGSSARRPAWLPREDLDHYVSTFSAHGFSAPLNYYRNIERNWRAVRQLSGLTSSLPALFLTGDRDMVASFMPADRMSEVFVDLRTVVVEGAGHWVHQQMPDAINAPLLEFLAGLPA